MKSKSAVTPAEPQGVTVLTVLWRKIMQIARFTMSTVALTFIKRLVLFVMEGVTLSCKTTF